MNNLQSRSIAELRGRVAGEVRGFEEACGYPLFIENVWAASVGDVLIKSPGLPIPRSLVLAAFIFNRLVLKCIMQLPGIKTLFVFLGYILMQAVAYPMQSWSMYPQQIPKEYPDDDYYYAPKIRYYYDQPEPVLNVPEVYGQVQYPYYYDPYGHLSNERSKDHEERLSALPIGQETWFENEATPRWRGGDDDVNAAFLDNLILTQMAQDAQRRRENTRAAFQPVEYDERDVEDEDVRELKALAGKPLYHVPKTVPRIEEDDYPADDSFINWNGNKRSVKTTSAPILTTVKPKAGQQEIVRDGPSQALPRTHQKQNPQNESQRAAFYETIVKLLAKNSDDKHVQLSPKGRKIEKRFVAGDTDLVLELRGLKHRIAT